MMLFNLSRVKTTHCNSVSRRMLMLKTVLEPKLGPDTTVIFSLVRIRLDAQLSVLSIKLKRFLATLHWRFYRTKYSHHLLGGLYKPVPSLRLRAPAALRFSCPKNFSPLQGVKRLQAIAEDWNHSKMKMNSKDLSQRRWMMAMEWCCQTMNSLSLQGTSTGSSNVSFECIWH